jgi:hypothetical protein
MDAKTYLSVARREDGSIRPLAEILDAEHRAKFAARSAEILADREAEAKKSETQKRIDQHQAQYDDARHNDDYDRAKMYKTKLDMLKDQLASERATEARNKAFAADPRIALIRTEADCIAKSGNCFYQHASQIDLDNLVAIALNDTFPDPDSQFQAFKELSDRLTDAELEAERIKASDAELESLRKNVTIAESNIRTAELQQARARLEEVADE